MNLRASFAIGLGACALVGSAAAADLPYAESFSGPDGSAWPAPWFAATAHVTVWDQQAGRARWNGSASQVARMILPGYSATDVEVEVTFEFENVNGQGIGFYVRQNGGSLREYLPHGQGYAMFLKGSWAWPEDLGLWREIDGVETQFANGYNPIAGGIQNGVRYRLRFRVVQLNASTTRLQARVWPEASPEPVAWTIEANDTRPELQGTAGSFAADIYNHLGAGHVFIDDLAIRTYASLDATAGVSPQRLALSAPHPNPIVGEATFLMAAPASVAAELYVFDPAGRQVARPFAGTLGPAGASVRWSAIDGQGRRLAPGLYFAVLQAGSERVVRRALILR